MLGLLIVLALLTRRTGNIRANRLLAGSLACSISYLCGLVMVHTGTSEHVFLARILVSMYILGVPLMYGYVGLLVDAARPFSIKDFLHLAPWTLILPLLFSRSLLMTAERFEAARGGWPPHPVAVIAPIIYLLPAIYMYASLRLIRQHQRCMELIFSYEERHTLYWLKVLVFTYFQVAGKSCS